MRDALPDSFLPDELPEDLFTVIMHQVHRDAFERWLTEQRQVMHGVAGELNTYIVVPDPEDS